jgi:hypothetical protein
MTIPLSRGAAAGSDGAALRTVDRVVAPVRTREAAPA